MTVRFLIALILGGMLAPAVEAQADSASPRLRVAVVQMFVHSKLEENRDRIVAGIGQAAAKKARVAVFPERALSGEGEENPAAVEESLKHVQRAAREKKIYVVSGAHSWLTSVKKTANWMFVVGPDGNDVFRYEKVYDNHRARLPGVFRMDGVPCGTMICADRWLRGVVEIPIQQGAQINFELSNNYACEWVPEYGWYWSVPLALRNGAWCVLANSSNIQSGVAATSRDLRHGHSAIIAPDGTFAAVSNLDTEDLLVADIEPALATRAEARARATHPALRAFWEAGDKLQRGDSIDPVPFKPIRSPEAEITIAAAPVLHDLSRIEALIREARERKADLIAFPAQAIEEDTLGRLQAAAREHRITVVVGAEHRETGSRRNSAFVIGPDGAMLTRYDQLSAEVPFQAGSAAGAMWFRVKGVAAYVTIGRDALWTELSELAAVAGARIHIHLEHDSNESPQARQQRIGIHANFASFRTLTATVDQNEAMLWEDLHGTEESRAVVKGTPKPDIGKVEVDSPFSANLVARASSGGLVLATFRIPAVNDYHPKRTSYFYPQMKPWYELGARNISPAWR